MGTGIDLVDIVAFAVLVADKDAPFVRDHFTAAEVQYCESGASGRVAHYAARYAAKEALLKAVDSAYLFRPAPLRQMKYSDVEVVRDPYGRPYLHLQGDLQKIVESLNAKTHVSLSHDGERAIAQVVLSC